jgi:hypothetical protein
VGGLGDEEQNRVRMRVDDFILRSVQVSHCLLSLPTLSTLLSSHANSLAPQEYLQRLAQAKPKDSKSLSKEVLEQRKEIERSRNERNKVKAFYLDRENAAARGRLKEMAMYR